MNAQSCNFPLNSNFDSNCLNTAHVIQDAIFARGFSAVQCNSVKIIIDNVDVSVKTRFVRSGRLENISLHYINSYAVQGRINFDSLIDVQPHSCANSPVKNAALLLPSIEYDKTMLNLFVTHVSRILTTHMKYFKLTFDDVVD